MTGKRGVMLALGLVAATAVTVPAQQRLTDAVVTDPVKARFVTADIENFIGAMDRIAAGADTAETLEAMYIDAGTPGLEIFIEKYGLSAERLQGAIRKYPEKYASLGEILGALKAQESSFREVYAGLKREIPDAVFPPTYFLVGAHRGIGSGSVEGPLITVEKKSIDAIHDDLPATLVHEMVHMEQLAALGEAYFAIFSGEDRTLLALSIREGIATYFAERVVGGSRHKNEAVDYLLAHEADLWERFQQEMLGMEMGEWLWSEPDDPAMPRDLGYAIGARIVESYHERAEDKAAAVREIMGVTDYPAFLARSGYAETVNARRRP